MVGRGPMAVRAQGGRFVAVAAQAWLTAGGVSVRLKRLPSCAPRHLHLRVQPSQRQNLQAH